MTKKHDVAKPLIASPFQEAETLAFPVSLVNLLPADWPLDIPLVRISTCGYSPVRIEVLQGFHKGTDGSGTSMQPIYALPDNRLWKQPGMTTAPILLEMLASQPRCVISQDMLMQYLRQRRKATPKTIEEDTDDGVFQRPENVVTLLRKLLYPPALQHLPPSSQRAIRLYLVAHIAASKESGPSYCLASAPLVWLDVEVMEACAKQIPLLTKFGSDPLRTWQAISEIGLRGPFLPQESYSDWTNWRRMRVGDLLWQSVDAQQQRFRQQKDQPAGKEAALRLLFTFWQGYMANEDAFRVLAELLGNRERFQQAEECYAQLCATLEYKGYNPHERTMDVMKFVRAKAIQRKRTFSLTSLEENSSLQPAEAQRLVINSPPETMGQLTSNGQEDSAQQEFIRSTRTTQLPQFPLWHVPYLRNPFFTGREELLARLHNIFHTEKTVVAVTQHALCGLGGIGKTQLALEYAYRYCQNYQAVLWIKADTRENLLADVFAFARLLHLPEQAAQDYTLTIAAVKQWLQSHDQWLLILDNADDLALTREFLPAGHHGHILFTTRMQALGGLAYSMQIEEMDQEIGALFLLRRAGLLASGTVIKEHMATDYVLAQELVREVGGLPLALDQAGAYIEETSMSLQEYLDAYRVHRLTLLKRRGGLTTDHPEPVAATWALAFEQIETTDPLAADILRLCAFLDPDTIPEEILLNGIQHHLSPSLCVDQLRLSEAIGVLLRFSLVRRNRETRTLTLHRLVQAVLQDAMDEEIRHLWSVKAAKAVYQAFPQASTVYSSSGYPSRAVQRLTASIILDREQEDHEKVANEYWNLAVQQQVIGKLSASEQHLQKCLDLCQKQYDLFNLAKAHQYFALLRTYQGDFSGASNHLDKALSLFQIKNASAEEGRVWAYRSLCSLLSGDAILAYEAAMKAWKHANEQQTDRDLIRARWLLGWAAIQNGSQHVEKREYHLEDANQHLRDALDRCKRTHMVDYEADLLLAWARLYTVQEKNDTAIAYANESLAIAYQSGFRLLQADIHLVLAQNLLSTNGVDAERHGKVAMEAATCDGVPYSYVPALIQAKHILLHIRARTHEKEHQK